MKKLISVLSNPWIKIPFALIFLGFFVYTSLIQPLMKPTPQQTTQTHMRR